jgi:hypothetical protein
MRGDTQVRFLDAIVRTGWKVDHSMIRQSFTRVDRGLFHQRDESRHGKYYHVLQKSTIENIVPMCFGLPTLEDVVFP